LDGWVDQSIGWNPEAAPAVRLLMARVTTWINASLVAAVATVATVGFIDAAGMNDAPTVAGCVEDCNPATR
jgi:hypothetical protein